MECDANERLCESRTYSQNVVQRVVCMSDVQTTILGQQVNRLWWSNDTIMISILRSTGRESR